MQIHRRDGNKLRKCAVRVENSHDTSVRAVPVEITSAKLASAACEVNFANHALIDQFLRSFNNGADELMSRHPVKIHIALEYLQIGGADPGEVNFDQSGVIVRLGSYVSGVK